MSNLVTLMIDGVEVSVAKGTLVVDAAKQIGNDIPVFCYHPKMEPVGMCRMCLVEIGLPIIDRATGQPVREADGSPKLNFGKGLQTGCTVQVAPGMVVRTQNKGVTEARKDVLEFLLTSHPLDCPICDKGGECPLQNLTMRHGPGVSRFDLGDKMQLAKHVPLGDLIYLDRERCIQCARCIRFQDEVVSDPVIAFHNRGRRLEIVTNSEPGFDSIWSGNTTDICPVGALTTADFRFGARPWEMTPVASLCPHCPVGCNTTMSTRPEAKSDGRRVIKRIMPRQNEQVNEIWICDKGRFVHHFADSPTRLTQPMVRKNGQLVETSWDEALKVVADKLQQHKTAAAGLAGDRLSNEDLYLFQKLFRQGLGNGNVDQANSRLAGGDVIAKVGLSKGSNLGALGKGDAVVVVATDLHQEAPVWWLRLKQAAKRGAIVVVLNGRPTRLDDFAKFVLSYDPGRALEMTHRLLNGVKVEAASDDPVQMAASALANANNLVAFYGGEGLTFAESDSLAKMLANLLLVKNSSGQTHTGRVNNGLVAVWPHNNSQGAWDMGLRPNLLPGYKANPKAGKGAGAIYEGVNNGSVPALYVLGADPVGDGLMPGRGKLDFLVVQELFLTETAKIADVVLPAQSWAEREGTYTNGERRIQRFYPALAAVGNSRPDWQIVAQIGELLGMGKPAGAASLVFAEIAKNIPQYKDLNYRTLARVEKQWPDVGGQDLYYGGNAYENKSGLGQQWPTEAETSKKPLLMYTLADTPPADEQQLPMITVAALFRPGTLIAQSAIIQPRLAQPTLHLHSNDAARLGVANGEQVAAGIGGNTIQATAHVNGATQPGLAILTGAGMVSGRVALTIKK